MPSRTLRPLVPLLIASLLTPGCAAWREVRRTAPTQYLAEHHPGRVRLTLQDSTLVLHDPMAAADSIVGSAHPAEGAEMRVAVPGSQVRGLAVRGPSTWPMWIAVGVYAAVLVAVMATVGDTGIKTNP